MTFSEFLNANTIEQIELMADVRFRWYEKQLIRWWIALKKSNSHINPVDLFESVFKGRF